MRNLISKNLINKLKLKDPSGYNSLSLQNPPRNSFVAENPLVAEKAAQTMSKKTKPDDDYILEEEHGGYSCCWSGWKTLFAENKKY